MVQVFASLSEDKEQRSCPAVELEAGIGLRPIQRVSIPGDAGLIKVMPALAVLAAAVLLALSGRPAMAAAPRATVEGVSDGALRRQIEMAVGPARTKPRDRLEARRRAEDAAEPAALALRSEGYYAYSITPQVSDRDQPVLKIDPGPQFRIGQPGLDWVGPPPDEAAKAAALEAMNLKSGQPGRAADVVSAGGRIVTALKARGYADAKADPRQVVADFATDTLTPTFQIEPGAIVRLDGVRIVTNGRTKPSWAQRLAPWKPGAEYRPNKIAELERRLNDTGIYRSVEVSVTPPGQALPDGTRPVVANLVDRDPISVQLGASYSSSEGVGVDSAIRFYNRLGIADTVSLIATVAQIEKLVGMQLSLPHVGRPDQTLVIEPAYYSDQTNAFQDHGERLRLTLKRRLEKTSFLTFGVAADNMRDTEYALGPTPNSTVQITRDITVVSGSAGLALDRSNNLLNPTNGWRFTADVQPAQVMGQTRQAFVRLQAQTSGYLPLDGQGVTVLAARLRAGSIVDASVPELPAPLRFYSGGGGSVRGYTYQGIGPHFPNGAPEGGAGLFETSFETRRMLFGPWGVVAFLDGGSISGNSTPDLTHVEWAAGIGARYFLGFGPLRADIAFPLDHSGGIPSLQVYLGLGQAF